MKGVRLKDRERSSCEYIEPGPFYLYFNLNISRYISTATADEEIDLAANHAKLMDIEEEIKAATAKHNEFLKELGLPLLP